MRLAALFLANLIVASRPSAAAEFGQGPTLEVLHAAAQAGGDPAALSEAYDGPRPQGSSAVAAPGRWRPVNLTASLPDPRGYRPGSGQRSPEKPEASPRKPLSQRAWMGIGFLGAGLAMLGFLTIWPLGVLGVLAFGTALYKLASDPDTIVKVSYPDGSTDILR